ncbi:MAG: YtxH domain-containing protein [Microcystaceae cyanobacterium]
MANNNKGGFFVAGIVLGSVVGAVTSLLLAPRSGKETRKILQKSAEALPEMAEDVSSTVQWQTERLSASAVENWNDTLNRLKDAIATGVEVGQLEAQHLQPINNEKRSEKSSSEM